MKNAVAIVVSAAATLAIAGTSNAAITVYTSLASFNAATTAQGTDTYAGFSITSTTPSPIVRNAGAYTYTARALDATNTDTLFFGAGTTGNPWLSTNTATDSIQFSNFSSGVNAVGGNFFGSNISGLFQAGDVVLLATDSSGSVSQTIVNAQTTSFLGFVSSTGSMTSLRLSSVQPASGFLWSTADNLVLAKAVPAPGASLLAVASVGLIGRRRR